MTTRSLALVMDNSRPSAAPTPRPGYRECLARGECQKCRAAKPGVRTVGARRPDEAHWIRLALCCACIELAREQGYPVVS